MSEIDRHQQQKRILEKLTEFYLLYPEMQLGETLGRLTGAQDTFYLRDDVLEASLDRAYRARSVPPPAQRPKTVGELFDLTEALVRAGDKEKKK